MRKLVLVAGFPKCATTTLHYLLTRHPDVSDVGLKESRIAYPERIRGPRGMSRDEYRKRAQAFSGQVLLDTSPDTLYLGDPALELYAEMASSIDRSLLIVIAHRDPVERTLSHMQFCRSRLETPAELTMNELFSEALRVARRLPFTYTHTWESVVTGSRYWAFLESQTLLHSLALTGDVLALDAAHLRDERAQRLGKLYRAIGLSSADLTTLDVRDRNVTQGSPRSHSLHRLAVRMSDSSKWLSRRSNMKALASSLYSVMNTRSDDAIRRSDLDAGLIDEIRTAIDPERSARSLSAFVAL